MSKRPTDETPADDFLVATLPDAHVVDAAQVAADAAPSVPESHLPGPVKKQRTWERHRWTFLWWLPKKVARNLTWVARKQLRGNSVRCKISWHLFV